MNKTFFNKRLIKKMIVFTSAAMIFATTPALSVSAAEANPQTSDTPAPQESQPASSAVPADTSDSNPSNPETVPNTPAQETPSPQLPADTTIVTPQTPADTTTATPQPAPSAQPLPEQMPADQGNVAVTPMQSTVYAASQKGLNVRPDPSTNNSPLGTLKYGQTITVTGKTADNWYQIQYAGSIGYVLAEYVSSTPLTGTGSTAVENAPAENPTVSDIDTGSPNGEAAPADTPENEDDDDESQTDDESAAENAVVTSSLLGTPVVVVLAIAIIGVLALIGYSVYGLFRKDSDANAYYEEDYADDQYPDDAYYENDLYSDDEYYEEEQYSDNEYYEESQFSDDEYYEETHYSDDEYYENDPYSDDEYYERNDKRY